MLFCTDEKRSLLSERPRSCSGGQFIKSRPRGCGLMLQVNDLVVRFGGLRAVNSLSFEVKAGMLTGLIGPNGAGKSTVFQCSSGVVRPACRPCGVRGQRTSPVRHPMITAAGLVRSFQIARGFPRMTVFEHLMLYDQHNPGESLVNALLGRHRREKEIAERALTTAHRLKLGHIIDHRVTEISGGQKKLLEIGRCLMAGPRLLLLDEPVAGVNPTLAEEIGDQLRTLVAEGLTILLIEHDMALVERIADHVVVMARGRRLAEGPFKALRENQAVQDAYLGGGIVADAVDP